MYTISVHTFLHLHLWGNASKVQASYRKQAQKRHFGSCARRHTVETRFHVLLRRKQSVDGWREDACMLHAHHHTCIFPNLSIISSHLILNKLSRHRNNIETLLRKRNLLARQVIHQNKAYAKTLRSIPRHLSQVAGTQCIDRHWRSLKEFIGPAFPHKLKGPLGSKLHPEVNVLVKQWLYRMWSRSSAPKDVYKNLTQILKWRKYYFTTTWKSDT